MEVADLDGDGQNDLVFGMDGGDDSLGISVFLTSYEMDPTIQRAPEVARSFSLMDGGDGYNTNDFSEPEKARIRESRSFELILRFLGNISKRR